jgi:hypothetical protein
MTCQQMAGPKRRRSPKTVCDPWAQAMRKRLHRTQKGRPTPTRCQVGRHSLADCVQEELATSLGRSTLYSESDLGCCSYRYLLLPLRLRLPLPLLLTLTIFPSFTITRALAITLAIPELFLTPWVNYRITKKILRNHVSSELTMILRAL